MMSKGQGNSTVQNNGSVGQQNNGNHNKNTYSPITQVIIHAITNSKWSTRFLVGGTLGFLMGIPLVVCVPVWFIGWLAANLPLRLLWATCFFIYGTWVIDTGADWLTIIIGIGMCAFAIVVFLVSLRPLRLFGIRLRI